MVYLKSISLPLPLSLSLSSDVLICETYNCTLNGDEPCYHGYEVCSESSSSNSDYHYCLAAYNKDPNTNTIRLTRKGCYHTTMIVNPITREACNSSSMCHIDNLLSPPENAGYYCCCGESLCNQNITFTHPTQVFGYGKAVVI